jgi:hypothetical protein
MIIGRPQVRCIGGTSYSKLLCKQAPLDVFARTHSLWVTCIEEPRVLCVMPVPFYSNRDAGRVCCGEFVRRCLCRRESPNDEKNVCLLTHFHNVWLALVHDQCLRRFACYHVKVNMNIVIVAILFVRDAKVYRHGRHDLNPFPCSLLAMYPHVHEARCCPMDYLMESSFYSLPFECAKTTCSLLMNAKLCSFTKVVTVVVVCII